MASKNGQTHSNGSTIQEMKKNVQKMMENDGISPAKRSKSENGLRSQANSHELSEQSFKDLLPFNEKTEVTDVFIDQMVDVLKSFVHDTYDRESKVIDFKGPTEVKNEIDVELKDEGASLSELVDVAKKALDFSVKTGHPRFYNQLFAGLDITGLMGQWVGTTANTSMYTYEMAPVFGTMERAVLKKLREFVGFSEGDGLLFPGGSISNMQAMNLARYKFNPNTKEDGMFGCPRLSIFCSEEAHYSTMKAAATLGFGTRSVKKVKTDSKGKMIVEELRTEIMKSQSQGERPFFVCATSGTTVAGAYDPLVEIAVICKEFGLWFHVDAAWGGGALLSKKHKHLLEGIERSDSVTWNPHKLMSVPVQCSVLLVKEQGMLQACNKMGAKYLFQKDKKLYDVSLDTGDKTLQCGRPNDIFKLWLMWKAKLRDLCPHASIQGLIRPSPPCSRRVQSDHYFLNKGLNGFEEHIDRAFENSRYLADQIKKRDGFVLLMEPECTNVCFRYIPQSLAEMPDGPEKMERLHKIPPEIKKRMTLAGTMMIGYQPLKDHVNFFRMIVISSAVTHADMDFVLDEIERLGKDL